MLHVCFVFVMEEGEMNGLERWIGEMDWRDEWRQQKSQARVTKQKYIWEYRSTGGTKQTCRNKQQTNNKQTTNKQQQKNQTKNAPESKAPWYLSKSFTAISTVL